MQTTDTATTTSPYYVGEPGGLAFKTFAGAAQRALEDALRKGNGKLFSVDTEGLFEFFLASFHDPVERQFHNCHCCQHFIKHYGGLVWIAEDGRTTSAVWDPNLLRAIAPKQYIDVAVQMKRSVENAQVVDQLLWKDLTWGKPEEGGFSHFYINVLSGSCSAVLTPGQDMAVRREDRKHLSIALGEMKPELIDRAIAMLEAGGLDRAETLLPMGKFLQETQRRMRKIAITRQNNILWHAVGQAARGWCTPRGSTFGALYYDIAEGKSTAAITRAHNEKMDPLKYQRPQAPPSAGNIKQAEKIVEQMGLAPALRRRPMALEEAELLWRPRSHLRQTPQPGSVFGHLSPKEVPAPHSGPLNVKTPPMTLAKFKRDVMPKAVTMRLRAPNHGGYTAFTTAADPEAPPLVMWDFPERRNPGAWYLYSGGSSATHWNLRGGVYSEVLGLASLPPDWYGETRFAFKTVGRTLIILKGCGDVSNSSLCIFPETIRNELHSVRSTIEAHSKSGKLEDEDRQRASGYLISGGEILELEVTTEQGVANYFIDRIE